MRKYRLSDQSPTEFRKARLWIKDGVSNVGKGSLRADPCKVLCVLVWFKSDSFLKEESKQTKNISSH